MGAVQADQLCIGMKTLGSPTALKKASGTTMVPPPSIPRSRAPAIPHLSVVGGEAKEVNPNPALNNTQEEDVATGSTLGSLKFFLDGQLVLKLNAQQEDPLGSSSSEAASSTAGAVVMSPTTAKGRCQWVKSFDTPKPSSDSLVRKTVRHRKHLAYIPKLSQNFLPVEMAASSVNGNGSSQPSSPSEGGGTDSDRSCTPEVAKKAKCSSPLVGSSPKPPWTPPVERHLPSVSQEDSYAGEPPQHLRVRTKLESFRSSPQPSLSSTRSRMEIPRATSHQPSFSPHEVSRLIARPSSQPGLREMDHLDTRRVKIEEPVSNLRTGHHRVNSAMEYSLLWMRRGATSNQHLHSEDVPLDLSKKVERKVDDKCLEDSSPRRSKT